MRPMSEYVPHKSWQRLSRRKVIYILQIMKRYRNGDYCHHFTVRWGTQVIGYANCEEAMPTQHRWNPCVLLP